MSERADEPESLGKRMQGLRGEARLCAKVRKAIEGLLARLPADT